MAAVLGGCVGGGCDGGALMGICASVFCNKDIQAAAAAGGALKEQATSSTGCGVEKETLRGWLPAVFVVFPAATGELGRGRGGTGGGLVGQGVRGGQGFAATAVWGLTNAAPVAVAALAVAFARPADSASGMICSAPGKSASAAAASAATSRARRAATATAVWVWVATAALVNVGGSQDHQDSAHHLAPLVPSATVAPSE